VELDASAASPPREANEAQVLRFPAEKSAKSVSFDRRELTQILDVYGRHVAEGEWRDYAMEFTADSANFAIFRRASEQPIYRIVKNPALARKQGMWAVVAQGGLILKRGQDLAQVLRVFLKKPRLAGSS
jgi:Protein of unknown function (DUF2794)